MITAGQIYHTSSIHSNPSLAVQVIQDGIDEHTAPLLERIKALEGELAKTDSALRETGFADMLTRARKAEAERDQATDILRRNLAKLRTDSTRQDYLDACQLCGVKPEVWE